MTGRDRIVVLVVGAVAVLAGFWFVVLSPKRAEVKAVDAQVATATKRLDDARASVTQAQAAKRDYDTDYAAVARLGKAVPVDDNVPSLVYQLQSVSHSAKVDFRSFKLNGAGSAPTPAPAPAAATTPPASGSSSSTPTSGAGGAAATTPAPATQLAASAVPPGATVGPAGFPTMPFTFIFDGSYFDMEHMLRNIDRFITVDKNAVSVHGRLLGIDGFALVAGPAGFPKVTATISATAYLLPADQGLTAGATPTGPAAAGTPAPGTTASSNAGGAPAPPTATATGVK